MRHTLSQAKTPRADEWNVLSYLLHFPISTGLRGIILIEIVWRRKLTFLLDRDSGEASLIRFET